MKNITKRFIAVILVAVMAVILTGCLYNENNTWAAKKGDLTLPIGGYIYFLNGTFSDAASQISTEEEILKGKIGDQSAGDWVREQALNNLNAYFYVNDKFDELGLELSDEDIETADSNTTSMWTYYGSNLETLGIAKDSFHDVYSIYSTKYAKLFEAMYGAGGEKEVSDEEFLSYYTENYFEYEYFTIATTALNEEGESEDLTDEEKEAVKATLEAYKSEIESGDTTVTEAASDHAYLNALSTSTYNTSTDRIDNITSDIPLAAVELADNELTIIETTANTYALIKRLPIDENKEAALEDENAKLNVLSAMKAQEFQDYVLEQAKSITGVTYNDSAMNGIKLSIFITDANKMGTSSVASESSEESGAESSATEESSGSEVSETESSKTDESTESSAA